MTVDGFFNPNPARQMRLAMSAELPCKIKPRMHANRRELLLQKESPSDGLISVYS